MPEAGPARAKKPGRRQSLLWLSLCLACALLAGRYWGQASCAVQPQGQQIVKPSRSKADASAREGRKAAAAGGKSAGGDSSSGASSPSPVPRAASEDGDAAAAGSAGEDAAGAAEAAPAMAAEKAAPASAAEKAAPAPPASAAKMPSIGIYTVNWLQHQLTIGGSLFWAQFLLVSRLYNRDIPTVAIVNQKDLVDITNVGKALREAGIRVEDFARFSGPGSRAHKLKQGAVAFQKRYLRLMVPDHHCANETNAATSDWCKGTAETLFDVYPTRFCWQADLANEDGVEYVATIDADAMLTDNVWSAFGDFMLRADVVTMNEWSSQVVMWKRDALNAFCDAAVELLDMDDQSLWYVISGGQLGRRGHGDPHLPLWQDMHFLQAWLNVMRPDVSRIVLCGLPSDDSYELCRNVAWNLALAAPWVPVRSDNDTDGLDWGCGQMHKWVEFRPIGGKAAAGDEEGEPADPAGPDPAAAAREAAAGPAEANLWGAGDALPNASAGRQKGRPEDGSQGGPAPSAAAENAAAAAAATADEPQQAAPATKRAKAGKRGRRGGGGGKGSASGRALRQFNWAWMESLPPEPPEVWTKFQYWDHPNAWEQKRYGVKERKMGGPQRVPLVHWQGGCKQMGMRYVRQYYTDPGLVPVLLKEKDASALPWR